MDNNYRIRKLAAAAALAVGLIQGAGACTPTTGCQRVAHDADHATPADNALLRGADYGGNHNAWTRGGRVLGYSIQEDSIVWNIRPCIFIGAQYEA